MIKTETLSPAQISQIAGTLIPVINRAVLSVIEFETREIWSKFEDYESIATVAVLESLQGFRTANLSPESVVAWATKAARWATMNAVQAEKARWTHSAREILVERIAERPDDSRNDDRKAIQIALAALEPKVAKLLDALADGTRANALTRKFKMSGPTITRRKQAAQASILRALAA